MKNKDVYTSTGRLNINNFGTFNTLWFESLGCILRRQPKGAREYLSRVCCFAVPDLTKSPPCSTSFQRGWIKLPEEDCGLNCSLLDSCGISGKWVGIEVVKRFHLNMFTMSLFPKENVLIVNVVRMLISNKFTNGHVIACEILFKNDRKN